MFEEGKCPFIRFRVGDITAADHSDAVRSRCRVVLASCFDRSVNKFTEATWFVRAAVNALIVRCTSHRRPAHESSSVLFGNNLTFEPSREVHFVVSAPNSLYSYNSADGTTVHDTHSCSRELSSAVTDEWVFSWRLKEDSVSSGARNAVGSRFQVLGNTWQSCAGQ